MPNQPAADMPFHLTSGVAPYGRSRSPQVNGPSSRLSSPHCSNKRGLRKGRPILSSGMSQRSRSVSSR